MQIAAGCFMAKHGLSRFRFWHLQLRYLVAS
jgi:hypothetical protein